LIIALKQKGCIVNEWSCPTSLVKLPRFIIDLLFVFSEQFIMPLMCYFGKYDKVIYPYNSCSILAAFGDKSLLIIHDFIPNKKAKEKISLSALYIILTQRIHTFFKRDVAFVSATTKRIARNVAWLKACTFYLFPNSFYILEEKLSELNFHKDSDCNYTVLISGNGENKEFSKAMELWKSCENCKSQKLKVIGLGSQQEWAYGIIKRREIENVIILPILSDDELISEIKNACLMWAHSTHEGFGRPVIEGRICGKNVLASNISAFREHRDDYVFLYNNQSFCEKYLLALLSNNTDNSHYKVKYHIILEEQIEKWLRKH
ncbi:TPA: glycosyltransferase, partial [Salmonella enterica]|nr:glycosyltransferase family 4 protein [Salmonella enterica]EEL2162371.1 glycosyltransferase family 4 protein [Salmonella enterica subsp. enterica serovar Cerro]EIX2775281.1 glycosyltransferase [Salmonella enterica subsp. enterica serovar Cerro]EIY9930134.1 glycosyltransferase [Salmonella enterica subsp. enterica serovar Cerro]EJX8718321.1 glycosyltransferase [Salmonella enterica subsp. enterica serovar Cerro]